MVGGGMRDAEPGTAKSEAFTYLFKLCLVGSEHTGKSATLQYFTQGAMHPTYLMTIGIDFAVKTVKIDGGDLVKLQIWDTAGQQRFRTITNSYYRGAHGIVIFVDVTADDALENMTHWVNEVQQYTQEDTVAMIVGSKCDLENRKFGMDEFEQKAKELGLPYTEISAKTGANVREMFEMILNMVIQVKKNSKNTTGKTMSSNVGPVILNVNAKKSKTCGIL